ncbi:MAG: RDD family protein [Isosphaeraceae bacterium]
MSIVRARVRARPEPLDCVVRVVTPERITLVLPLAGPARRFVAYLVDQMLLAALVLVAILVLLVLAMGSIAGFGPLLVAYFVLTWGYGAFCEGIFDGQTLGKYALGIRVVSEKGVAITGAQAVLRNLVGTADGLVPFCFLVGLATMFLSGRFQRVGDLAAGTIVVIEERRVSRPIARVSSAEVAALLPWLPRRVAAGSKLARVVSDYVDQRRRFTGPRRAEMAEHLARPLRARYAIPRHVPADVVLCAFYDRVFLGD